MIHKDEAREALLAALIDTAGSRFAAARWEAAKRTLDALDVYIDMRIEEAIGDKLQTLTEEK